MIPRRQREGHPTDLNTPLRHARGCAQHMMETAGGVPPALMAEARESQARRFLCSGRDSRGKFTGFGTRLVPQCDRFEGRFAQMMPPKEPGGQEVQLARTPLKSLGVVVEGHGQEPVWN